MAEHTPGFRITSGKGFHMTFANGWTVSVQFGYGNYCDNRDLNTIPDDIRETDREMGKAGCATAEVAVWGPDGEMVRPDETWDDTVKGWQEPDQVADLIQWAVDQPKDPA